MILRVLTVLFLAATIAAAANDVLSQGGMASLGQVWFSLSPETLNLSQAVIQRYVSPELWTVRTRRIMVLTVPLVRLIKS